LLNDKNHKNYFAELLEKAYYLMRTFKDLFLLENQIERVK